MRRLLLVLATAACVPALGACLDQPAHSALGYTADAKRAYDQAMEEFNAHNWLPAQALFREVKKKYSYSRYARLAELRIADADFEQEKYADAVRAYKQFVHDHRSDVQEVTYARARIAEAQYKEISESFLLPASEERDQATTLEAYKEMRAFLHDFPEARESAKICVLVEDVTVKLVKHELYVARFYLARDNYDAAVARAQYALRNYATDPPCPKHAPPAPSAAKTSGAGAKTENDAADVAPPRKVVDEVADTTFGLAPEALLLLGETYLKMHRWPDARAAFHAILERYSESALVVQANNFLAFMRAQGV